MRRSSWTRRLRRAEPIIGVAIRVINPGEPSTSYHLLIVEGQERRLRAMGLRAHCPLETLHGSSPEDNGTARWPTHGSRRRAPRYREGLLPD
jgi:hypothetical protein